MWKIKNNPLTNSSRGTFKPVGFCKKTAKATPVLKAPDEGVMPVKTQL